MFLSYQNLLKRILDIVVVMDKLHLFLTNVVMREILGLTFYG